MSHQVSSGVGDGGRVKDVTTEIMNESYPIDVKNEYQAISEGGLVLT